MNEPMRTPMCPKCDKSLMQWNTNSMVWLCRDDSCDGYCTEEEFRNGMNEFLKMHDKIDEKFDTAVAKGAPYEAFAWTLSKAFSLKPNTMSARNGAKSRYG